MQMTLRMKQKGVVLFIALIVLVAMTLAGIALMRSVDTATVIAGNLAFKQSTLQSADQGVDAAYQWLLTNSGAAALNNDSTAAGYFSARPFPEPDWSNANSWANAFTLNNGAADAAGNVVSYIIHRMCTEANTAFNGNHSATGTANQCGLNFPISGGAGGSKGTPPAITVASNPQVYYRITSRSAGPRNTETITQTMVAVTN
ncbi:MAG: hypothetical protein H7X91_12280 [Burkholderiales bacterium]|nr:hypothetical protein [Burkholderiales bacterium]